MSLVNYLADRVLEAASAATLAVNAQPWAAHLVERGRPWESPVVARMAHIRRGIKQQAQAHGWAVTDAQLDDRHIVRRMILKKAIFGVDKNPMAVELAKTALWLHTFTVGAPLSFLDHHLRHGDSLHGERLGGVQRGLQSLGMLFQQGELDRLQLAARRYEEVADLTDIDVAEVQLSQRLAADADAQVAPLHALLDFWRALRWLVPGWPVESVKKIARLGDERTRAALVELLAADRNLVAVVHAGHIEGEGEGVQAANELLAKARALAHEESFFHWWTAFPTVFKLDGSGGFDVVLGNPPWDRIKLQEVEWFAEREPNVALQVRASDRKKLIGALQAAKAPLWTDYVLAVQRAEANARVLGKAGDYSLLGGGDVNLYSLFVERAQGLVRPDGLVALLMPSGIAADKGAAAFFKSISTTGRLGSLLDFENRNNPGGSFFPDVDSRFKFCILAFGGTSRSFERTRCAFFLHGIDEVETPERVLALTKDDFALVNPNTGAAPIFRSHKDAEITTRIYRDHPVLVRRGEVSEALGAQPDRKVWPVKYARMFDMTNDSALFMTRADLVELGFAPAALGRWRKGGEEAVPLYEGKMVQMFDHRAADVVLNAANLKRAAQQQSLSSTAKESASRFPTAQYWVRRRDANAVWTGEWCIAYKSVTAPSNVRTMIVGLLPACGVGNSMAMILPAAGAEKAYAEVAPLLTANLAAMAFDYVLRQKVQGQNLNWFIVEQAALVDANEFDHEIGRVRIADFIRDQVLHLSYTAHDLAPFARDMGHVETDGSVKPPFVWDDEDRRARLAALDALFFHLYGIGEVDAAYILDTFPIVRQQDVAAFGLYRTKGDVLDQLRRIGSGVLQVIH